MRGCKSDRQESFESHTLGHMDRLRQYGLHLTGNAADADDLVQETYLKAYRFWETCDPDTNVRAWLFRILKNSFINRYRSESRNGTPVEFLETMNTNRDGQRGGDSSYGQDPVFANALDDDMADALSALPDNFRTVLILCDIEGLPYGEIASFLACPLGTVRSRLHRARLVVRLLLERNVSVRLHREVTGIAAVGSWSAIGKG
jgi:RNA polymerase sigma-70 factor, ECF subfamily